NHKNPTLKKAVSKKLTRAQLEDQVRLLQSQVAVDGTTTITQDSKQHSVNYSDDMCRVVLELRYSTHRDAFNANLSAKQLSLLWEKLALRFNI
ncbi:unnamed protein product, partial [Aphanomyces euteiches]